MRGREGLAAHEGMVNVRASGCVAIAKYILVGLFQMQLTVQKQALTKPHNRLLNTYIHNARGCGCRGERQGGDLCPANPDIAQRVLKAQLARHDFTAELSPDKR